LRWFSAVPRRILPIPPPAFPDQRQGGLLGVVAVGLALLMAIDSVQADTFGVLVAEHFDCVPVEDGNDRDEKVSCPAVKREPLVNQVRLAVNGALPSKRFFTSRSLPILQYLQRRQRGCEVGFKAEKWIFLWHAYYFYRSFRPEVIFYLQDHEPVFNK